VDKHCTAENSLREFGSRDAFAVGKIIIRIDQENCEGPATERYSCLNANELCAARKAEDVLKDINITVPMIYFCGSINGKNVTVESRVPGVSLEVAWRYLTEQQRDGFKQQCRDILQRLGSASSPPDGPSYVCRGLNSQIRPYIQSLEQEILFSAKGPSEDLCLVHNDMVRSNIIVNNNQVAGILGWRQSGFFGHDRARRVHRHLRTPGRDRATMLEEEFGEELTWADLYDSELGGVRQCTVAHVSQEDIGPIVKIEPSITSLDKVPMNSTSHVSCLDGTDMLDELPTPKKINNLKRESISRASSSDRSSPTVPSKSGLLGRNTSTASSKRGPAAKKQAPKKRKLGPQDTDSLDGCRSNTPASTRANKSSTGKKQRSVSAVSSPAPESKKTRRGVRVDDTEDNQGDEVFCTCRKPDNHTWMIACDGGCEDWFHGKCVNIDPEDADLIEKYICKLVFLPPPPLPASVTPSLYHILLFRPIIMSF
jgi:COMPASS component SPP1